MTETEPALKPSQPIERSTGRVGGTLELRTHQPDRGREQEDRHILRGKEN